MVHAARRVLAHKRMQDWQWRPYRQLPLSEAVELQPTLSFASACSTARCPSWAATACCSTVCSWLALVCPSTTAMTLVRAPENASRATYG